MIVLSDDGSPTVIRNSGEEMVMVLSSLNILSLMVFDVILTYEGRFCSLCLGGTLKLPLRKLSTKISSFFFFFEQNKNCKSLECLVYPLQLLLLLVRRW